jgi:hypothetical protein
VLPISSLELFTTRKAKDQGPIEVVMPLAKTDKYIRPLDTWTPEQDRMLNVLVEQYGFNWHLIADCMNGQRNVTKGGYSPQACCDRWLLQNQGKSDQPTLIPIPHPLSQSASVNVPISTTIPPTGQDDYANAAKNRKDNKQKGSTTRENKKKSGKAITLYEAFQRTAKRREQIRRHCKLIYLRDSICHEYLFCHTTLVSTAMAATIERERRLAKEPGHLPPGIDLNSNVPTPRALCQMRVTRELQFSHFLAQQTRNRAVSIDVS